MKEMRRERNGTEKAPVKAPVSSPDEPGQEPYKKGKANQFDPESCADSRERAGEALTGGSPGRPLSSEIIMCVSTWSCPGEGHTLSQRHQDRELAGRDMIGGAAESETLRRNGHSTHGNREISAVPCGGRYQWAGRRWVVRSFGTIVVRASRLPGRRRDACTTKYPTTKQAAWRRNWSPIQTLR